MLLDKIKNINKNHITVIFKGNFVSKFLLVIGGLLLAKYYGAPEYGVYNIYLSIVGIFTIVLGLGQEHLVVLEEQENDVKNIFSTANVISVLLTIILFLLVLFPIKVDKTIFSLGLITSFFFCFTNNAKFLLAKEKRFREITVLTIADAFISFLFQLIFVFIKIENGLIIGSLIGFFAAFAMAIYYTRKSIDKPVFNQYWKKVKARKEVIKYTYPSTLVNALGNNILPILISFYFVNSLLGEYSLAVKIMSVPLLLVSSSIATVYYPKAAQIKNEGNKTELWNYTKKMSRLNFLIILSLYVLINIIGIPIIKMVFSKDWEHLGIFIFLLSFAYLTRSLVNPIADILTVLKRNNISLLFNIYLLLANIAAIFIGKEKGIVFLVSSFSLFLFVGYGLLYYYIMLILKKYESS